MDIQSHVELTCLHGEHLRTLIDHILRELTMIERTLATKGNPALPS